MFMLGLFSDDILHPFLCPIVFMIKLSKAIRKTCFRFSVVHTLTIWAIHWLLIGIDKVSVISHFGYVEVEFSSVKLVWSMGTWMQISEWDVELLQIVIALWVWFKKLETNIPIPVRPCLGACFWSNSIRRNMVRRSMWPNIKTQSLNTWILETWIFSFLSIPE